jgi:hypothetical protein
MYGKHHTLTKNLYNLTSKTATINITKYILNIRSCSPIICQISDQFLKLVLQLLRKNISCSYSINKNDKSCFKWYISIYIFQYNCVNIYDRLCFFLFFQSVSRKYNFICEIVFIESTEGNNIFETRWVILCQFKRHSTITCIFHLLRNNVYTSTKFTM